MMWYMTTEPCHVSVLCIKVCDPGGIEWSHQCCTGPSFVRVSISMTLHRHLTLVVTYRGSPRSMGVLGYSVHPWPIDGGLPAI